MKFYKCLIDPEIQTSMSHIMNALIQQGYVIIMSYYKTMHRCTTLLFCWLITQNIDLG